VSEETIQLIAAAVVTLAQVYVLEPWKFPVFAAIWDVIARIAGHLANYLANVSMRARLNYFTAVHAYGD
jgi:hypothetical protein